MIPEKPFWSLQRTFFLYKEPFVQWKDSIDVKRSAISNKEPLF